MIGWGHIYHVNTSKKNANNCISINVSTNKATKYMKQKMAGVQGEIEISTIIFGDFNLSLSQ